MLRSTSMAEEESSFSLIVLILFFLLFGLIAMLVFMYKKLNKETNGEYTIRNMVYKEGGVRDRLRGVALALETRLGVQLWPHDDIEMQEVRDEEAQVKIDDSQAREIEEKDGKAEEEEEDSDTSDEESHLESSEADEEARLNDEPESEEKEKEDKTEGEGSGGTELLISLNQFSGSAIWSEEKVGEFSEVTPL